MIIDADLRAVVTGGASGLGAAVARLLAAQGARVALFDLNHAAARALATQLRGIACAVDVSDAESVAAGLSEVRAAFGGIDVLANCAGIAPAAKTVSHGMAHDAGLFARVIGVNLMGSFNCASQAAAIMSENAPRGDDGLRGVVLNTASIAAYEGQVGQIVYAASKGGVVSMTLPMARDLAPLGIRVCTLAPGLFCTPLLEGLPPEVQASLGAQVPFPARLGAPAEFACHVIENDMLNGEVIRLDGALRMNVR